VARISARGTDNKQTAPFEHRLVVGADDILCIASGCPHQPTPAAFFTVVSTELRICLGRTQCSSCVRLRCRQRQCLRCAGALGFAEQSPTRPQGTTGPTSSTPTTPTTRCVGCLRISFVSSGWCNANGQRHRRLARSKRQVSAFVTCYAS